MAASAERLCHRAHIEIVLGAQADPDLPGFVLTQEQRHLHPLQRHGIIDKAIAIFIAIARLT